VALAVLVSTIDIIRTESYARVFGAWELRIVLIAELGSREFQTVQDFAVVTVNCAAVLATRKPQITWL
jgi:hypothetical protein